MFAPVIHILPLTTIRRERILPVPGKVIARQGQKVAPRDVIAEADAAPEHLLLNIARGLGVSTEQADDLMQRVVGDDIDEGDLIAGPVGLTRRVVRAPVSGQVVLAGDGQVLIKVDTNVFELRAGISGTVTQLLPSRGAVIETTGSLIQGVWGNGHTDFGLMQPKLASPDDKLTADQLDMSLRGAIVLGGHCQDAATLKKAAEVPLRGLVLASMPASLIPVAKKIPFPVLVLDGFGVIPMNLISYNLLSTHQNREISVSAAAFDRYTGVRPEVIIPLPASRDLDLPLATEDFAAGQKVRIVRAPYHAHTGAIETLLAGLTEFPSGIRTQAAVVQLDDGEGVNVPLANLEVIT